VRKLILRNFLAPGDIVMLTAAVRDLHRCYPGQFVTDVRTACAGLWENSPHITPVSESDPEVEVIDCSYPLINRSNDTPYHCLHGFIEFLNERLGLNIKPTAFKGDIHLSELEKTWYSQVHELTRCEIPFWIVAAGGKYDVTIKWWEIERYQKVVDHFRDKIQFVQVGAIGHYHPKLEGVIDLRGRTNMRELVRLVYHAQGILCSVTALMHLAAAVEVKGGIPKNRPCVVVAGGREPVHWEAYPDHQFIATNGALNCCSTGGCWKARTVPLGDGDERDKPEHLCVDVVRGLPRCMDLIPAAEVIRRIELYFNGGMLAYLAPAQRRAARRGQLVSADNEFDDGPLTLHNARLACEHFIRNIPRYPEADQGKGIVICAGGVKYFTNAWVSINMLRRLGCSLPIQLWHLGDAEMDEEMKFLAASLNVECVDGSAVAKQFPIRNLGGWELKPYAIVHSSFREVIFLDADNVPVVNPEYLFDTPHYQETGAIFWPDYGQFEKTGVIWESCGLQRPAGPEFESGQIVVDKGKCWRALRLALWFNEHSDFYYQHLYGDKETFHLAFHKLKKSYAMVETPIHRLEGTMCQHDFAGNRVFQHRNTDKWNLFLNNKVVEGFWFEEECRQFVKELRDRWDGRSGHFLRGMPKTTRAKRSGTCLKITACIISCPERHALRERTLRNLAATDWGNDPVLIQIDAAHFACRQERQKETALLALQQCLHSGVGYVLFLEDDVEFNRHLRHNLEHWTPFQNDQISLAGLYNPGLRSLAWNPHQNFSLVASASVFGSQAFVISRQAVKYFVNHWDEVPGMQDIKMSRLAGHLREPLFYHTPSLVQHIGSESVWGGTFHQAVDFDPHWKA
jgi:ADP-heptose:LPS heptosyltransferase